MALAAAVTVASAAVIALEFFFLSLEKWV